MNIILRKGIILEEWEYFSVIIIIILLVLVGGLVAGLTIGLMSLDATNLTILKVSGSEDERKYAAKIEPIRKNGHLLLVTLLLVNTVVNESLPILFGAIHLKGWQSVLFSTCLVVLFGEIIPQAICSRYGLQIGAFFAFPVLILIKLLWIISYPIAKLLDWILGHKDGMIYRHAGLKELVALHSEDQAGPLSRDEVNILRAVLDLRTKTVTDVMTHLSDVFMFSANQQLDRETIEKVLRAGHSRIPVYLGSDRSAVIGALLVKQLLLNNPDGKTALHQLKLRKLPRVCKDTPLYDMLHVFEGGASHMALVTDDSLADKPLEEAMLDDSSASPRWYARREHVHIKPLGIITLEDVIEELIGEEIIDETDQYVDMQSKVRVRRNESRTSGAGSPSNLELNETTPLLECRNPLNPNSALVYRPINLPTSILKPNVEKSKRSKKELFHINDLTGLSEGTSSWQNSPILGGMNSIEEVPDMNLTIPHP